MKNYKWVILAACLGINIVMVGLLNSTSSLYIVPASEQYGFSRAAFSLVLSMVTAATLLINLGIGEIYGRIGIRKIMAAGFIAGVCAFLLFANAKSLPLFYLGGILMGIAITFTASTPLMILVQQWFNHNLGIVMGVISAGSGLGGYLFSYIVSKIIAGSGVSAAYLFTAVVVAAAAVPVLIFIREKPRETAVAAPEEKGKISYLTLLRDRRMLCALIGVFLMGLTIHPVLIVVPGHLQNKGFDPVLAASIYGAIFLALVATKILTGIIHDRFGVLFASFLGMAAFVAGTVLLIIMGSAWQAWIFVVVYAFAVSPESVLVPLIAKDVLGEKNYSRFLGIYIACMTGGITIGIPIINGAYDLTGSYTPVMAVYAVFGVVAILLFSFSLSRKKQTV